MTMNDDMKRSKERPGKPVTQKDVPNPPKKVGDESANPLPDDEELNGGGDPGRSS